MIDPGTRAAIHALAAQGVAVREISRLVKVSRNSVRRALRATPRSARAPSVDVELAALIEALYARCAGNVRSPDLWDCNTTPASRNSGKTHRFHGG